MTPNENNLSIPWNPHRGNTPIFSDETLRANTQIPRGHLPSDCTF